MSTTELTESAYDRKIHRLVELSADGYDAYDDIDWDTDLDPEDPRLRAFSFDPLVRTRWYQALPQARQSEVGLLRVATSLRIGWEFENLLQQGLLSRAFGMRNTNASFRYLHTEVMEESQHTLMMYEFVRRHAPHARGMAGMLRTIADPAVYAIVRKMPTLFYFLVLGGEVPIDYIQRRVIKEEHVHPLVKRIMEIHVEEEARHVAFAGGEIRRRAPELGRLERRALALAVPAVLGLMAPLMVNPSPWLVHHYDIPRKDLAQALAHPDSRAVLAQSVARIRTVCKQQGLLTREAVVVWKRVGLWAD
ncbi:hypothetical protein BH23ACT9_BH23ACT9_03220 [soil metagenome]